MKNKLRYNKPKALDNTQEDVKKDLNAEFDSIFDESVSSNDAAVVKSITLTPEEFAEFLQNNNISLEDVDFGNDIIRGTGQLDEGIDLDDFVASLEALSESSEYCDEYYPDSEYDLDDEYESDFLSHDVELDNLDENCSDFDLLSTGEIVSQTRNTLAVLRQNGIEIFYYD